MERTAGKRPRDGRAASPARSDGKRRRHGERGGPMLQYMVNAASPADKRKRSGGGGGGRFRQGKLTDCKKVVVLADVEHLRDEARAEFKSCLRIHASTSTTSSDAQGEDHHDEALERAQDALAATLGRLENMFIALETLKSTGIGKVVNKAAQADSAVVGERAKALGAGLVETWRKTAKDALARVAEMKRTPPVVLKRV